MRIFQTIHKYPPHIPIFEKKYGITDSSGHSFAQLQQLIIQNGYASSYILLPAIEGKTDEVFFTIWNYERMQYAWAKEHGMTTADLGEIKRAQIEWYNPDVFYDFSAMKDIDFLTKFPIDKKIIKVCWYGIIRDEPWLFPEYNIRITLHKPYVKQWQNKGYIAHEMQPAFVDNWKQYNTDKKEIDILFYGQYLYKEFSNRSYFMEKLLEVSTQKTSLNIEVHLQMPNPTSVPRKWMGISLPFLKKKFPSDRVQELAMPPLYGEDLYETIGKSKFVLNAYTNYNKEYKSNMRLFESLGCGSLLISENGNYPKGFSANENFIPYDLSESKRLFSNLESIVSNYSSLAQTMQPHIASVQHTYSKVAQLEDFKRIVEGV